MWLKESEQLPRTHSHILGRLLRKKGYRPQATTPGPAEGSWFNTSATETPAHQAQAHSPSIGSGMVVRSWASLGRAPAPRRTAPPSGPLAESPAYVMKRHWNTPRPLKLFAWPTPSHPLDPNLNVTLPRSILKGLLLLNPFPSPALFLNSTYHFWKVSLLFS